MQIIIHPRGHFVQIRDSSVHIANIYIVYFIFFCIPASDDSHVSEEISDLLKISN